MTVSDGVNAVRRPKGGAAGLAPLSIRHCSLCYKCVL